MKSYLNLGDLCCYADDVLLDHFIEYPLLTDDFTKARDFENRCFVNFRLSDNLKKRLVIAERDGLSITATKITYNCPDNRGRYRVWGAVYSYLARYEQELGIYTL